MEHDPWGKTYKLVMGKLIKNRPPQEIQNINNLHNIVRGLFPVHPLRNLRSWMQEQAPKISDGGLTRAASSLRNKIAPGMDSISNEVLKVIVKRQPETLLKLYNKCLEEGKISSAWKRA